MFYLYYTQFTAYMSLVKEMLTQIESEQKKKLEQIELMEKEKSIIPYTFANASLPSTANSRATPAPKAPDTMVCFRLFVLLIII